MPPLINIDERHHPCPCATSAKQSILLPELICGFHCIESKNCVGMTACVIVHWQALHVDPWPFISHNSNIVLDPTTIINNNHVRCNRRRLHPPSFHPKRHRLRCSCSRRSCSCSPHRSPCGPPHSQTLDSREVVQSRSLRLHRDQVLRQTREP